MSTLNYIKISQRSDNNDLEYRLCISDTQTKISAFIPMLVSIQKKRVYLMKCLFPNGTYVSYRSAQHSQIIDEENDLPVYELTHQGRHCIRMLAQLDEPFPVKIRLPDSQIVDFVVIRSDSIPEVKQKIASQCGLDAKELRLFHEGEKLRSNKYVYDYELSSGDILEVQIINEPVIPLNIFVKTISGKSIVLHAKYSDTIQDLKQQIQEKINMPIKEQRVMYICADLIDLCTLDDYWIHDCATLHLNSRLCGGEAPSSFVDVEKTSALESYKLSSTGPKWLGCTYGINIEGKCTNSECQAHNERVIYKHGFHLFDLLHSKAYCPMCKNEIVPLKPGFVNCLWRIVFIKQGGEYRSLPYQRVKNEYQTYDEAKAGTAQFTLLHVEAYPLWKEHKPPLAAVQSEELSTQQSSCAKGETESSRTSPANSPPLVVPEHCMVCLSHVFSRNYAILPCGHGAHKECLEQWKKTKTSCPLCDGPIISVSFCSSAA